MRTSIAILLSVFSVFCLSPELARADEAADKKAELQKKKEEAKKKAEERAFERKTAASAADKAAADKAAADKAAADKAAADKAAADKAAADKGGSGGASGTGGAAATSAGGAAAKSTGGAATKLDEKEAALPVADIETLRKDRSERRKASVERARKRWGTSVLSDPKAISDLKEHVRRVAFLQRARIVADAKKDKKSVELVDLLLTEEDQRHSNAMNALREGALSVGANK